MCTINRCSWVLLILLLTTKSAHTQYYNTFRSDEAVMLQVNGESRIENRLNNVLLILPNSSNFLDVKLKLPSHLMNDDPGGFPFDLKMGVNPGQIQDVLTSVKSFLTHGFLTLNNITKPVLVKYIPLPAGPDQDGNFKLSMVIQLDPVDFNLANEYKNSQLIISINDVTVNRV